MIFDIIGEGHDGVVSCDEEILYAVEADTAESALNCFAQVNHHVRFDTFWNIWVFGPSRKIWAVART
jgi:hypothetical protein